MDVNKELKFLGKFKKENFGRGGGYGGGGGRGERSAFGGGGGVRVDVNEELKFL